MEGCRSRSGRSEHGVRHVRIRFPANIQEVCPIAIQARKGTTDLKDILPVKNGRWARRSIFAAFILVTTVAFGGLSVTVAWNPNPEPDIAGYKVYAGTNSGRYSTVMDAGKRTDQIISNLATGRTYYFAATAYDTSGLESDLSPEVELHGS